MKSILKRMVIGVSVCVLAVGINLAAISLATPTKAAAPLQSWEVDGFERIGTGNDHSCGLTTTKKLFCWGGNSFGQLGNGTDTTNTVATPTEVTMSGALAGKTVTDLKVGRHGACVLAENKPYCWGYVAGYPSDVPVAIDVSGALAGKTVTAMSTGSEIICFLADGTVYCQGYNGQGALGDGTDVDQYYSPVAVDTSGVLAGKTVTAVSSSTYHTCAVANGQVYCWGVNAQGTLGNGTTQGSNVPVAVDTSGVLAGKTVTSIGTSQYNSCALADGEVYCWGSNAYGQLGDGSFQNSLVPVAVDTSGALAGKTITSLNVDTASSHACVIASGSAYCWGLNSDGQLGNGTSSNVNVPVAVDTSGALAGKTVTDISTGWSQSCAVASSKAYCWGNNSYSKLGLNSLDKEILPQAVIAYRPVITSVDFSVDELNRKILNIRGSSLLRILPSVLPGQTENLVTLNGAPLGFCTTPGLSAALLASVPVAPQYYSETPACYKIFNETTTQLLVTNSRYQVWVPDNFDSTAPGSIQVINGDAFNFNSSSSDVSYITNLPSNLEVSDPVGTDVSGEGIVPGQTTLTLLSTDGIALARVATDMSTDRNWAGITAGIDEANHKVFVHGLVTAPGVLGGVFSLYVPKDTNDNSVVVCPGAASLGEVYVGCANARTLTVNDSAMSVVTINGKTYWKIDGLTGTGAISLRLGSATLAATGQSLPVILGSTGILMGISIGLLLVRRRS